MMYFENAQLEFFGVPMAYLPYFSTPDPTVKRKTGFLMPWPSRRLRRFGFGVETPFYWAIAPDYDATFSPRITTRQGVLFQGEFRQRLINGSYQIRAYGIDQLDPGAFAGQPGDRQFRGGVDTKGQFALNDKWVWGWDGVLLSDYYFFSDYRLAQYKDTLGSFLSLPTEAISQLYLTGVGNRSYFDARTIYYLSYSGNQSQVPIIHPVIDYSNVLNRNLLGGEFSYKTNFTSLSRDIAAFDPITLLAANNGWCLPTSADPTREDPDKLPAARHSRHLHAGDRPKAQWRRSFTDDWGQIWTPFAKLRVDAIDASISNQPGVSNFLPVGDTQALRVMPTVGLEYRYPFINVQPWGTTTVEPIAQVIIRPNETYAGKLPNEDAQSLVFDASNLFSVDKFSGYDRVEGGGRANVGVQATTQFDRGGSVNVLFGQSYQLFGLNSFAVADVTNTGLNSGLDKPRSDYVARVNYSPNRTYTFSTRARFDEADVGRAAVRGGRPRQLRSLVRQPDVRQLRSPARIGIPDPPRRPAGQRFDQGRGELGGIGRRPLGSCNQPDQSIRRSARAMWTIASFWRPTTSPPIRTPRVRRRRSLNHRDHAADRPADARQHGFDRRRGAAFSRRPVARACALPQSKPDRLTRN